MNADQKIAADRAACIPDVTKILTAADRMAEAARKTLDSDGCPRECLELEQAIEDYLRLRGKVNGWS